MSVSSGKRNERRSGRKESISAIVIPGVAAIVGIGLLVLWATSSLTELLQARVSGLDGAPDLSMALPLETPVVGERLYYDGTDFTLTAATNRFGGLCARDAGAGDATVWINLNSGAIAGGV